jgi:hypothetical protein
MTAVMIGVDPHKGSHTAVAIDAAEEPLGRLRVRASASQAQRLVAWAAGWPERTWAVEGAGGLGHLLAQQLVAAGERVLDVPPKLGARVRLLTTGASSKNDPAPLRSAGKLPRAQLTFLFGSATPEPGTTLRPATPPRRTAPPKPTSKKIRQNP